jgi:hypothetical protein
MDPFSSLKTALRPVIPAQRVHDAASLISSSKEFEDEKLVTTKRVKHNAGLMWKSGKID